MTTFAVTDPEHTLAALNYALSNLGAAAGVYANNVLTVDNVTNTVTVGVGGEIYSYNVQWLNIRYATNASGTQGFSTSPTNAGYYGLQASADQYPTTINDPAYYTWNQVAGGFGTTNFLFYQTPGGRQITFDVANTAPNSNFLVVQDGTPIDLDIVTTVFIANSVITGNNIVPGTITGNLIAANTITSVNIANNTITGNDIALYTIQANNIANGVIAVSSVSNGNSNIQVANNGPVTFSIGGSANVANISASGISTSGNVTGNILFGYTISTTGTVSANNAIVTANIGAGNIGAGVISASGNVQGGNIKTVGLITATGNITGNYFIGNGSQLTGVSNYSNANVDSYLPIYTGNISAGNISVTGNITGNYIIGNGSQLTGLPAGYANADVANYLASGTVTSNILTTGLISATGNLIGGNVFSNGFLSATGNLVISGNANIDGGVLRSSNATVSAFTQSTLTTLNLATGANIANINMGNISVANINLRGNVTIQGNSGQSGNLVVSVGNITIGGVGGAAYFKTTATTGYLYNTATDVYIGNISANVGNTRFSGNIVGNASISATSNITGGNLITAGIVSSTGNAIHGNILTGGLISATGNIIASANIVTKNGFFTPVAYASLPTAIDGARAYVNDANLVAAGNFGNQISGGGSNSTPVWSDGTNWYIG